MAVLTTCLFRQNRFNIYFNYHSDADECLNNSHNCSENATCTNTEGSFNCSCKPGYIGNGHNCSGWFLEFLSRFPLVLRLLLKYNRVNVQHCTFINWSKLKEIVTSSFYNNFIYLFIYYLLTYSNLTSQSSRIVDNDSELISIYLHNAETKREWHLTPYFVLRWEYKIRWLTEINSIHLWSHFLEKERSGRQLFLFLEGGLVGGKFLSHTTNQLHFGKQLLHNFTLDRNIMIHNTARSGCGLINAEALLGGYKWRHYIRTY